MKGTSVEFHLVGSDKNLAYARNCGGVPAKDDLISIKAATYKVIRVTWCLDHSLSASQSTLRANVALEQES